MDSLEIIEVLWTKHRGKVIGVILGLIFGLAVIFWGFWKAVFVTICIVIGLLIGKAIDSQFSFKEMLNRMFRQNN